MYVFMYVCMYGRMSVRSVLVTAPDYSVLKLLHTARRLFQKPLNSFDIKQKQDMARRFSVGYQMLLQKYSGSGSGSGSGSLSSNLPADILHLHQRLTEYQNWLDDWGLKDYQVEMSELNSNSNH